MIKTLWIIYNLVYILFFYLLNMNIETFNANFAEYEQSYKPKYELTPLYVKVNTKEYWIYSILIYNYSYNDTLQENEQKVKITVEKEGKNTPIDKVYILKNPERIKSKISYLIKKHKLWEKK